MCLFDKTLKDIMSDDLLFGGKIVILGGDFRQLLPIIPRSIRSEEINLSIKSSILWNAFHKFQLTCNMRGIVADIIEFFHHTPAESSPKHARFAAGKLHITVTCFQYMT